MGRAGPEQMASGRAESQPAFRSRVRPAFRARADRGATPSECHARAEKMRYCNPARRTTRRTIDSARAAHFADYNLRPDASSGLLLLRGACRAYRALHLVQNKGNRHGELLGLGADSDRRAGQRYRSENRLVRSRVHEGRYAGQLAAATTAVPAIT